MNTAVKTVQIPGLSIADILVQDKRLVLGQDAHCIDSGIHAV